MLDWLYRVFGGCGEPSAWIIDRPGHMPTLTHYRTVAEAHSKQPGVVVTAYYSQVRT